MKNKTFNLLSFQWWEERGGALLAYYFGTKSWNIAGFCNPTQVLTNY